MTQSNLGNAQWVSWEKKEKTERKLSKAHEQKQERDKEKKMAKIQAAMRSRILQERFQKERDDQVKNSLVKASQLVWASQNACFQFLKRLKGHCENKKERYFDLKRKVRAARIIQKLYRQHKRDSGLIKGESDVLSSIQ